MSQPLKNVLLIGAGGRLGPHLLSAFTADPTFTVSVLTRHSSSSTFPSDIRVHRTADDYPTADLLAAFAGQDAVVSAIATAGAGLQKRMIDAAVQAGVKRFVPSEFGSDTANDEAAAILPYVLGGKRDTVAYLETKERDGLTWTAFVTGPFFELGMGFGFMGFDVKNRTVTHQDRGDVKFSATKLASIGLAVKNAMLVPDKTANQRLYISSITASTLEIAAAFEKATGTRWEPTHVDSEEQKKIGMAKMAKRDFSGQMLVMRYINCVEGYGGNYADYRPSANELLGLPQKESLDELIALTLKTVA